MSAAASLMIAGRGGCPQPPFRRCQSTAGGWGHPPLPLWVLVVVMLGVAPLRAADAPPAADPVIFPRATTGAEPAVAGREGSNPLLLVAALGALGAAGWVFWRQRRAPAGAGGRDGRRLAVCESRSLGNRQYLVVADYDGQKFLLGVCPGRIELLSKLDGAGHDTEETE